MQGRLSFSKQGTLSRLRWIEMVFFLLLIAGLALVFHHPAWLYQSPGLAFAGLMAAYALAFGIMYWEYRLMDELQQQRLVKASAAGFMASGLATLAVLYWAVFNWKGYGLAPALRNSIPPIQFETVTLCTPFLVGFIVYCAAMYTLYRRDMR